MINTVRELVLQLTEKTHPNNPVLIDGETPTGISSYRGFYEDLAIECGLEENAATKLDDRGEPYYSQYLGHYHPGHLGVSIVKVPLVSDLVHALQLCIGKEFEGYKGGQFAMTADTRIWVSRYGECSSVQIETIEVKNGHAELLTKVVDDSW